MQMSEHKDIIMIQNKHNHSRRLSVEEDHPQVQFTQERLSNNDPIRPRPIRLRSYPCERFEARLQTNDAMPRSFDQRNKVHSAFILRLPAGEQTSPKYNLPMKRYISVGSEFNITHKKHSMRARSKTPEPLLSLKNAIIESTPQPRPYTVPWCSPPNLYVSPQEIEEQPVPFDIMLPSP